ncbi:MAG TPA: FAD-binding protein [Fimbriimonadaceae bacterium]|jgi:electron transfer flavoprotein alpha subunit
MSKTLAILFGAQDASAASGFAAALGFPYDFLSLSGEAPTNFGAGNILTANLSEIPPAGGLAKAIQQVAGGYDYIISVSSMASKDLLARVAGLMDAAMVTDAIAVESPTLFKRPVVAGSMIATVEVVQLPVVITFRPAGFKASPSGTSPVKAVSLPIEGKAKRISATGHSGSRPDLSQAKVVVSGGRPLKDAATFESVIGGLADALGGAVGATRAAVDSGIAPNELQVGQTGKIVAPDLYIAAGISGSTQHMAGIKDCKTIVAINKDPDAPIFEAADFGLVADLYEAIPEIRAKLGR